MRRVPSCMFTLLTWVIITGDPALQACSAPSALATPWRTPELQETMAAIDAGCGATGR
jgi:hypothetical protein